MILLKHILCAIPGYHLLLLSLNKTGYKALEKTCVKFLWGTNELGKGKKALVAWEEIARTRKEGGLDILPFETQAQALKTRYITQLLEDRSTEWVWMAKKFIHDTLKTSPDKKEMKGWKVTDALLLDPKILVTNSPTLKGILRGWQHADDTLEFKFGEGTISKGATINQLLKLYQMNCGINGEKIRDLWIFLANRKVKSVQDLIQETGDWVNAESLASQIKSTR